MEAEQLANLARNKEKEAEAAAFAGLWQEAVKLFQTSAELFTQASAIDLEV